MIIRKQNLINNKKLINTRIYKKIKIRINSKISNKPIILDKIHINKILISILKEIFKIKGFRNNNSKIKKTIKDFREIFSPSLKIILQLIGLTNNNSHNNLQMYLLNLNIYQKIKGYILLCKPLLIEIKKQNNYLFKVKKKNYVDIFSHLSVINIF